MTDVHRKSNFLAGGCHAALLATALAVVPVTAGAAGWTAANVQDGPYAEILAINANPTSFGGGYYVLLDDSAFPNVNDCINPYWYAMSWDPANATTPDKATLATLMLAFATSQKVAIYSNTCNVNGYNTIDVILIRKNLPNP